ncbi:MAG: hypothetical protein M3063_09715 [Actinomycetota bacterium]|nr:hypothetical protein [Actinomycetota bacterium]
MITARPATRARTAPGQRRSRQLRGDEIDARLAAAAPTRQGDRRHRRLERRRIVREEILVLSVLVLALIVTVVVLALQWLDSTPSVASSMITTALPLASGGLA